MIHALFVLIVFVSVTTGQRWGGGYCPTISPKKDFEKERFLGHWIEVEKSPSIFDLMMRCMTVDYMDSHDNTMNVVVKGVSLAGIPLSINGDGIIQDQTKAGYFSVRYAFGVPFQGTLTTILDTDYTEYAIVYSCTNSILSGLFHTEYVWLLTRDGLLPNPTRQNVYEKLDELKIRRDRLVMSDRATCPTNTTTIITREGLEYIGSESEVTTISAPIS